MKATTSTVLVSCLLMGANAFPSISEDKTQDFGCEPTDGWEVIASFYCGIYGSEVFYYGKSVGTEFASNTASQDSDACFEMIGQKLGKIIMAIL